MPETSVSDNDTQFNSIYVNIFRTQITHINTSVYHASSNGQAETFVNIFKRAYAKLKWEGKSDEIVHTFLLKLTLYWNLNKRNNYTSAHKPFPKFTVAN